MRKISFVLCLCVALCSCFASCGEESLTPDVMPSPIEKTVTENIVTEKVEIGDIQRTAYCIGQFATLDERHLAFEIDQGYFTKYYVKANDVVTKGQLLAEASSPELEKRMEELEKSIYRTDLSNDYTLKSLKVSLDSNKETLSESKKTLTAYQSELESLKSMLSEANTGLEAAKLLTTADINPDTGIAYTEEELASVITGREEAVAAVEAEIASQNDKITGQKNSITKAEDSLALEQQNYDMQSEFIRITNENNDKRKADLQKQLDNLKIYSPIDGQVRKVVTLAAEAPVNASMKLITIADPTKLQFVYDVKDQNLAQYFYSGREVEISVYDITILGVITQGPADTPEILANEVDSYRVYIDIPDSLDSINETIEDGKEIKMGTTGSMTLILEEVTDVVILPAAYVNSFPQGGEMMNFVGVLVDGIVQVTYLELGVANADYVEVVSGLSEGDEVVISMSY